MKYIQSVATDSVEFTLTDRQDLPAVQSISDVGLNLPDVGDLVLGDAQWKKPSAKVDYDFSDFTLSDSHD